MKINVDHVKKICKVGKEGCCCYLILSGNGFECAKDMPKVKCVIDKRTLAGLMNAKGNNCSGPPNFNEVVVN